MKKNNFSTVWKKCLVATIILVSSCEDKLATCADNLGNSWWDAETETCYCRDREKYDHCELATESIDEDKEPAGDENET